MSGKGSLAGLPLDVRETMAGIRRWDLVRQEACVFFRPCCDVRIASASGCEPSTMRNLGRGYLRIPESRRPRVFVLEHLRWERHG